jgi:hypothetical protein
LLRLVNDNIQHNVFHETLQLLVGDYGRLREPVVGGPPIPNNGTLVPSSPR